jgi:sugar transferase (PEP-CTERM system associated)
MPVYRYRVRELNTAFYIRDHSLTADWKTIVSMVRVFSHYVSARTALLVVLEALVLLLAIRAGISVRLTGPETLALGSEAAVMQACALALAMLVIMNSMGLYQLDNVKGDGYSFWGRLLAALVVCIGIVFLIATVTPSFYLHPYGWAITVIVALLGSAVVRALVYLWGNFGLFKPRVLVLGTGSRVAKLVKCEQHDQNHMVVGYVERQSAAHHVPLPRVLPMAADESLLSMVEKHKIDQIVVAVRDRRDGGLLVRELLECRLRGISVCELSTFYEREYRQVLLDSLNPSWMVLGEGFRQGWFRSAVKRLFDLVASGVLLLVTLPIMFIAAVCIVLESGMPVFYRQERVGQGGRVFTIYKFRSMYNDAEGDGKPRWASANDDRTTRVGRIIRKLRIDELPQIINVFKGEMSFVGPRPERPYFVDQLKEQIPYYSLRHAAKPGITGWAQVRYPYGASLDDSLQKLQYDLYYVKNHTLFLDLVILFSTVEVVLWGKGAR